MKLRDYPLRQRGMLIPGNVEIIVRERGKRVMKHCRHEHNIWVNLGREYLARVIAPNAALDNHYNEPPVEFVKYMGFGIGGSSQNNVLAYQPSMSTDYPPADPSGTPGFAGNQFADDDLTVQTLERPVRVYIDSDPNTWLIPVNAPPTFLNDSKTVRFDALLTQVAVNQARIPSYPVVPLSEVGLFLSVEDPDSSDVYDPGAPNYVGAGRQNLVAYNTYEPIPKTISFTLEVRWELRF